LSSDVRGYMSVFIYKNNEQFGPYSIEEVRAWVLSGQLQPTDWARHEEDADWVPLAAMLGLTNYQSMPARGYVSTPPSSGWGLMITGVLLIIVGVPLSVIVIGIPFVIAGIPLVFYGRVLYQRRALWELKESVRVGVVQGMPSHGYLPAPHHWEPSMRPNPRATRVCPECAESIGAEATYCHACGAQTL
jgi:hypothetical protein